MPAFCRHGRFVERCGICRSEAAKAEPKAERSAARGTTARRPAGTARTGAAKKGPTRTRGVVTRQLERASDDGFRSELVPGIRSTADALRFADELAFAAARHDELRLAAPGAWLEAAKADSPDAALRVLLVCAVASPSEDDAPYATIQAALATGQTDGPDVIAAIEAGARGPRADGVPASAVGAADVLAARSGTFFDAVQGDANWDAERRFARVIDRLSVAGLSRAVRYDFLVAAGRMEILPLRAGTLALGDDQVTIAVKQLFETADLLIAERRVKDLADALEQPLDAIELALWNFVSVDAGGAAARWSKVRPRATLGSTAQADPELAALLVDALT